MVKIRKSISAFYGNFLGMFREKPVEELRAQPVDKSPALPVAGGRVSEQDGQSLLSVILGSMQMEDPDYPFELLEAIQRLAIYDDDLSFAVDNIVQLGNTDYTITFNDGVGKSIQKRANEELNRVGKLWYSGGINSLINDLLANCVITGALSGETVPRLDLQGIEKVVIVPVKDIRIFYDPANDAFKYYQVSKNLRKRNANQKEPGLIELNPITYKYYAARTFGGKPYAIPPFAAALDGIKLDNDIVVGLKEVIKKLGVFGFLSVMVGQPPKKPNESDDQYYARLKNYLNTWVLPEIEKGFNKGFVAGFKDTHEFDMKNTTPSNVQGINAILELVTTKVHSGLKQDPMMLGRNQTTTETLGRVLLAKLGNQVRNYQKLVASFMEELILIHLRLAGFNQISSVFVEFAPAMIGDEVRDAQAYQTKLGNLQTLYNQGIIDQDQFATEAGYDKAAEPEPRQQFDPKNQDPNADNTDPTDPKTTAANELLIEAAEFELGAELPVFDYQGHCCGGHHEESFAKFPPAMEALFSQYFEAVRKGYGAAIERLSLKIGKMLAKLDKNAGVEQVTNAIIYTLVTNWKAELSSQNEDAIKAWVGAIYVNFRKDKSVLGKLVKKPEALFGVEDRRTIEYYRKSDSLYLGKFITDPDTKKKITKFVKDKHLAGAVPIGAGQNKEALAAFRRDFATVLAGEDWKIERVLRTTVNRMKNTAAVAYMQQAEIEEFERVEVLDRLTCPYCKQINGLRFSVPKAMDKIKSINSTEPGYIGAVDPFLVSNYKVEDLKGKSGVELQDGGMFSGITAHPNCRGRNVAVF